MTAMVGLPLALLIGVCFGFGLKQAVGAGLVWYVALAWQTAYIARVGRQAFGGKGGLETVRWWVYWAAQPLLLAAAILLVYLGAKVRTAASEARNDTLRRAGLTRRSKPRPSAQHSYSPSPGKVPFIPQAASPTRMGLVRVFQPMSEHVRERRSCSGSPDTPSAQKTPPGGGRSPQVGTARSSASFAEPAEAGEGHETHYVYVWPEGAVVPDWLDLS